jgi:hypothetical protein
METSSESEPAQSRIQAALLFLMHQVLATWIIFFAANSAIGIAADFPTIIGIRMHHSLITSVTRPPYFPAQILWAFFLGWSLSGFLRHRTMLWVWVVPSAVLGWLYIRFPNCPVPLFRSACLDSPSAYSLFFGRNCAPGGSCLYQLYFTYPFLAAVAYSLGALLARRMNWLDKYAEAMRNINVPRVCLLSGAFFCLEVARGWRQLVHRYPLPIWYTVILLVFGFAMLFAVSTYLFMVVISLIGRRFFVTRWFLDHPPPSGEDDPSAQTTSNA